MQNDLLKNKLSLPEIKECYHARYHINVRKAIDNLLGNIPQKHLSGINTIVLQDSKTLNHARRREKTLSRKRKVLTHECCGLYYEAWKGEPAWIEIFVDNVIESNHKGMLKIPLFRDMAFGDVLYHELGHHIHKTQSPQYKEKEDVAEQWREKLWMHFFKRKYWYVMWPLVIMMLPYIIIKKILRKSKH